MAKKRIKQVEEKKVAQITVQYEEGKGTSVKVDYAFSEQHAIWMLSQAIGIIVNQPRGEENESVQELPVTDGEKKEEPVSDVQE